MISRCQDDQDDQDDQGDISPAATQHSQCFGPCLVEEMAVEQPLKVQGS